MEKSDLHTMFRVFQILGLVTTYTVVIFQFYPANGLTNRAINNTGIY